MPHPINSTPPLLRAGQTSLPQPVLIHYIYKEMCENIALTLIYS